MKIRHVAFAVCVLIALQYNQGTPGDCWGNEKNEYDVVFALASKLTGLDGCALKAQALIENSTLDPKARSHAGARGCSQFMPKTWKDITQRYGRRTLAH